MGKHSFPQAVATRLLPSKLLWVVCLLALLITIPTIFISHKTFAVSDEQQLNSALLNEVKLLRQALERSQTTLPAFQILLERTRFQSDLVNRQNQNLNDSVGEMERAHLEVEQIQRRIEDLKTRQRQSTDFELQVANEREIKELAMQGEQQKQREDLYRSFVGKLTAQIAEEQAKLDELNTQLNKLQTELTSQPQRSK